MRKISYLIALSPRVKLSTLHPRPVSVCVHTRVRRLVVCEHHVAGARRDEVRFGDADARQTVEQQRVETAGRAEGVLELAVRAWRE